MKREFQVIIEKDSEGWLIADVPALKGCHTQAKSYDTLIERIKEAIELCLEVEKDVPLNEFVGIQNVIIEV
ncbi:MAG TPA: type II toxin-antitoxin system HicB family antitoxin [Candidatus Kapabacteria bacterium]|mgnify:CR=1 FL=1|nr:type II toxin-antitoxin system HicB family antitoxin [Candidatus Kapabacteria bacterium]HOV93045.1 type II toxin-antitoxin system HicB family antitoxin [Candidatus Kapabacteria bacterium]